MTGFSAIGSMEISGTTANRPTNAEIGQTYFDTDIARLLTWDGTVWQNTRDSVVATSDGLTTGLIPAGCAFAILTVTTDANDIATLPAPVVGKRIVLQVGATGCELRTVAASNVKINDVDSDGTNELALAADQHYVAECISATEWIVRGFTALGADAAALVPDAA